MGEDGAAVNIPFGEEELFDVVVEKLNWPLDVVSQLSVRVLQGQKKQIGRQSLSFHTLCPSKTKFW